MGVGVKLEVAKFQLSGAESTSHLHRAHQVDTKKKDAHARQVSVAGRHPAHLKQGHSLAKSQTMVSTKALSPKVHYADQMLVLKCSAAAVGGTETHAGHTPRKCMNAMVRSRSKSH